MTTINKMVIMSHSANHSRSQGFTLIEALIALLVLSIGLLGVAGMQIKALQGAHMAYQRSLASVIAVDAQERFWSEWNVSDCPAVSDVLLEWKKYWFGVEKNDRETLPGGNSSTISLGDTGACSYKVTVDWSEERLADKEEGGNESGSIFEYQFSLPHES